MSTNLLDTFIIAFGVDTGDAQTKTEQVRDTAAAMADEIDRAGNTASDSADDLKSFFTALTGSGVAALATFSAAIAGLVAAQDKMSDTGAFASGIGAQAADVAVLEELTLRAGGSVEKTRTALSKLSEDGGDAVKNLGDVAKAMEKLPDVGKVRLGEELGLDRDVIAELSKGYDHYSQMVAQSKANMPYTERDFTAAREVSHLWNQVKASMDGMPAPLTLLSVKLSGLLKEVLTLWRDFNQSPMSDGMVKAVEVAAIGLENMWKMIKLVGSAVGWVYGKLKEFIPLIAGIGGALLVALMPLQYLGFGLIIAGIAALLLVLDDLRAYFQGENSLFGEFLEEHPRVAGFIHQLGALFSQMGDAASAAWDILKEMAGELWEQLQAFLPTTDDISGGFAKVTAFLEENKDTLISVAKAAATLLAMWLAYKAKALLDENMDGGTLKYLLKMIGIIAMLTQAWKGLTEMVGRAWAVMKEAGTAIASKLGLGDGGEAAEAVPGAAAALSQITAANAAPVNGMTSAAISNATANSTQNTTTNIGKVEVHTQATDADGITRDMNGAIRREYRAASDHFDDGRSH